jgi:hypothetical protein
MCGLREDNKAAAPASEAKFTFKALEVDDHFINVVERNSERSS